MAEQKPLTEAEKALAEKRMVLLNKAFWDGIERKLATQSEEGFQNLIVALQSDEGNPIDIADRLHVLEQRVGSIVQRNIRYR